MKKKSVRNKKSGVGERSQRLEGEGFTSMTVNEQAKNKSSILIWAL